MVAITTIAKELPMLWSLQPTHLVLFSELYWPGQLRVSPFSREPAPNLMFPSTSFSHRRNYNRLCWPIPPPPFFQVYVLLKQARCWPIPKLHKEPPVSFLVGGRKGVVVWCWYLVCITCSVLSGWIEKEAMWSRGSSWEERVVTQQRCARGTVQDSSEELRRSACFQPRGSGVLGAKSAPQAALGGRKERKRATCGGTWSGWVSGLEDSVKVWGTEPCGIILVLEDFCDLSQLIFKWGSTRDCPWVYVRSWASQPWN